MKKVVHFEVHFVILYSKTELLNHVQVCLNKWYTQIETLYYRRDLMDFIITIVIGVIVGVTFSIWLTNNKMTNLIISTISAVIGAFIGVTMLNSTGEAISNSTDMFFIIPTLVGSVCLTLLVLFIIETSKDIVRN